MTKFNIRRAVLIFALFIVGLVLPVKVSYADFNSEDVLEPSNVSAEELESGLLYTLSDYSDLFIEAEKETGINALFLASVAALESGWGNSSLSDTHNNLYGWTQNDGSYYHFNDVKECVNHVSSFLKEEYLSEDGVLFSGFSVSDINTNYNGNPEWEKGVISIMGDIQRRIDGSK